MSEFDEAIEALKQARNGEEFRVIAFETGKLVNSDEQLKDFTDVIYKVREKIFELDPDFKREIEARKKARENQFKAEKIILDAEMRAELERYETKYAKELGDMVTKRGNLICPICREVTGFNFINDKMICSVCGHELVEKDDLRDYNRAYRRKWRKNK